MHKFRWSTLAVATTVVLAVVGLAPPAHATHNDNFSGAVTINGYAEDFNHNATVEAGEPRPCNMNKTIWFTFVPSQSGGRTSARSVRRPASTRCWRATEAPA